MFRFWYKTSQYGDDKFHKVIFALTNVSATEKFLNWLDNNKVPYTDWGYGS